MNELNELRDEAIEDEDVEDSEDTVVEDDEDAVVDDDDGDVIDLTGEMNIDSLVARLDSGPEDDLERKRQVRRRLEELRDAREASMDLDSTYNFNLEDEI